MMQKDDCKTAMDGASCEASSESTGCLSEGLSHHTKCQKLITFTGVSCTDIPKDTFLSWFMMKLQVEEDHHLDVSSLYPRIIFTSCSSICSVN